MQHKTLNDLLIEANNEVRSLDYLETLNKIENNKCVIIDVREESELIQHGYIKNAINIPRGLIEFKLAPASANNPINIDDIEVVDDSGLTKIITPIKPKINPNSCFKDTVSFNQKYAIIIVLKAVVAFKIASILESDPKLARENMVKGIALFVTAKTIVCFHIGFKRAKYLG